MLDKFWQWLERYRTIHIGLSAALFLIQLFHLYWLFTHIVLFRLTGHSYYNPNLILQTFLILADYTEIPALISTSFLYLSELRQGFKIKNILFLFLLNSQWLHLFWITDEVIYNAFTGHAAIIIPAWLSWVAIAVDYFELPVIYDTIKQLLLLSKKKNG